MDWDPVRHFLQQSAGEKENKMVLSVSWPTTLTDLQQTQQHNNTPRALIRTMSIQVPFRQQTEGLPEAVKRKLVSLMLLLHHVFFGKSNREQGEDDPQTNDLSSAAQLFKFVLSDRSLLTRAIVALGSGHPVEKVLPSGEESNVYQRSTFLAFWAVTEMMRRATSKRSGVLQDFIAHQLSVWQAPHSVIDLLCRFRISSSTRKIRLNDIDAVNSKIVAGWKMQEKKWSVLLLAYDNLGFRILGARAGYDQYTMIQVHEGSKEFLASLGFYLPPGSTQQPISRKRLDWAEERENVTRDEILPSEEDYGVFGNQLYAHIDALMQVCNEIPNVDEARELLQTGDSFNLDGRLTTSYGARFRLPTSAPTVDVVQEEQDDDIDEVQIVDPCLSSTMYNLGHQKVEIDLPLRADLNKKETVQGIVNGALDLRERSLSAEDNDDTTIHTNERPVMEDLGISIAGDGYPSYTFLTLRAANPDGYKNIHNFIGGFHWDLNMKQRHGLRFGDSHLKYFLHPFRDTDKKKDWYLSPGDPGQTSLEQPEMTDAHYVMAMRGLSKVKHGQPMSAVDVDDWMLERAQEHDLCMTVLMDLRFAEIGYMIRDSEREGKRGNLQLFRIGAKLSLLLFARTHATKYVRIAVEYWIWWRCCSEADKILYEAFFFTKLTVNGTPIWVDRFVEWMNKDVREYLGKYAKPNQELLLQRAALLLKDRKRDRSELNRLFSHNKKKTKESDNKLAISVIFCHQMDLIDKLNLWSDGAVKVGKGECFEVPQLFTDPSGENELNTESLFDVSSAEEAIKAYFEHSSLSGEVHQVTRSEKDVSLRMTPILLSEVKQARIDEFKRRTSADSSVLALLTTKVYLASRLSELIDAYPFLAEEVPTPQASEKKGKFSEAVAKAHELIVATDPDFRKKQKEALNEQYILCDGFASQQRKRQELQRPFYSIPQAAKREFFERKYSILYTEEVDEAAPEEEHADERPTRTPERAPAPSSDTTPFVERQFGNMSLFSP
jgi:hypothetical protein